MIPETADQTRAQSSAVLTKRTHTMKKHNANEKPLTFEFGVFQYTGAFRSTLMTEDEKRVRAHATLYALMPIRKVDPANVYAFVVDSTGKTITVLRRNLKFKALKRMNVTVPRFSSYAEEVHAQLNGIVDYITQQSIQLQIAV